MSKQPIKDGVTAILDYCHKFRSDRTIRRYKKACNTIQLFYEENKKNEYDTFCNDKIRDLFYRKPDDIKSSNYSDCRYILRALAMLDDYYNGNPFRDQYPIVSRYKHQLEPVYQQLAEDFKESLNVRKNTVPVLYSIARDFFYYIQQLGITDMDDIQQETLYSFLKKEYQNHQGCMNNVVYVMRLLCTFLNDKGFRQVSTGLLPFSLPASRKKVYPGFSTEDIGNILSQPDRSTSSGKRDYAVLLLASLIGIRSVDIANLKLSDIRWRQMSIHFIQSKTGNGVSLPLDAKAGSAISDYILNGRPDSDSPYVFLTESKPAHKMRDKSSISNILVKHMKLAGIEKKPHDGKSFHAFRRSMGIWLLDTSSNPETISQILGHQSRDVLKCYLPLTESKLSICALDFESITVKSEVYR